MSALLARNMQISHADLAAHITPYTFTQIQQTLGTGVRALALANTEIDRQAQMIASADDFHLMMLLSLCALPLLLLLRNPARPRPGAKLRDIANR